MSGPGKRREVLARGVARLVDRACGGERPEQRLELADRHRGRAGVTGAARSEKCASIPLMATCRVPFPALLCSPRRYVLAQPVWKRCGQLPGATIGVFDARTRPNRAARSVVTTVLIVRHGEKDGAAPGDPDCPRRVERRPRGRAEALRERSRGRRSGRARSLAPARRAAVVAARSGASCRSTTVSASGRTGATCPGSPGTSSPASGSRCDAEPRPRAELGDVGREAGDRLLAFVRDLLPVAPAPRRWSRSPTAGSSLTRSAT